MKRDRLLTVGVIAGAGVIAAVACTFPDVGFKSGAGGAGGQGTATAATTTATASGSGGHAVSNASSTSIASTAASSSAGTGGVFSCGDAGPCDCDGDGDPAKTSACGGGDCNDHDPLVSPKQKGFFADAGSHGYDYNCSGGNEFEITQTLDCKSLLSCDTMTVKWHGSVPDCGVQGTYGTCTTVSVPVPACAENLTGTKRQGCH